MIRLSAVIAGLLVLSATGSAFAEDATAIKLGLRLGYEVPSGKAYNQATFDGFTVAGDKLSSTVSSQVPIGIDAGYMITPNVLVGLYGQYGFAQIKNCDAGESCSGHGIGVGVQGQYHIMPGQGVDPWLGLGFGYESLSFSESAGGTTTDVNFKGWELLKLQGGVDFQVANAFTAGPFLSFSLNQFSSGTIDDGGASTSAGITSKSLHEWITFGAKGTFGL